MWRLTTIGISLIALAAAIHVAATKDAFACSRGDFDPVRDSDIIVEGRYVSYNAGPAEPVVIESPKSGETSVFGYQLTERIEFAVARSLKGSLAQPSITIVNRAWVDGPPSGSCGGPPHDPTGKYSIIGLVSSGEGTYAFNSAPFFSGSNPGAADYDRALSQLASRLGLAALPSLGSGPTGSARRAWATSAIVAAFAGLALLSLSYAVRIRSRGTT